jgi:hypothetical protein
MTGATRLLQARSEPLTPTLSLATRRPDSSHRCRVRLTPAPVAAPSLAAVEQQRAYLPQARARLQQR